MMPIRLFTDSRTKKISKKGLIGLLILVAFITTFTFIGVKDWENTSKEAHSQYDQLLIKKSQIKNAKTRDIRLRHIREIASMKTDKPLCEGTVWNGWQTSVFAFVRQIKVDCQTAVRTGNKLIQSADALKSYLDEEKKLLAVLGNLKIDASSSNWQTLAHKSVQLSLNNFNDMKLYTPGAKSLRNEMQSRSSQIDKKWTAVEQASDKKDKNAYQQAVYELKDAYKALAEISLVSSKQLQPLVDKFIQ